MLTNNHRARVIHHHTLNEVNSRQLLEAAGIVDTEENTLGLRYEPIVVDNTAR